MLLKGSAGAAASQLVRVAGFTAAPVEAWGSWPAHEAGTPSLASSATSQRVEMPRVSVGTWSVGTVGGGMSPAQVSWRGRDSRGLALPPKASRHGY